MSSGFTLVEQAMMGQALGRIHTVFAHHRLSRTLSPWVEEWFSADLREIEARIDSLLGVVAGRDCRDEFDVIARSTLTDRRIMLAQAPALLASLPRDLRRCYEGMTPPTTAAMPASISTAAMVTIRDHLEGSITITSFV